MLQFRLGDLTEVYIGYAADMLNSDARTPRRGSIVIMDERAASAVMIAPHRGAIVTSFRIGERELLYLDESTFDDPSKNVRGGIPILFPSPGKLANDSWQRDGRQGEMKQHGFARTLPWSVKAHGDSAATLALESNAATLAQYPWPFSAEIDFLLRGRCLRINTRVRNTGTSAMPFGLGFHPYFAVADKSTADVVTNAARAYDSVAKQAIAFTGFDLTAPEVDMRLLDHTRRDSALVLGDGTRIVVRAAPEFTQWVIWTLAGKPFVCLEPWTAPGNALNTGEGLIALAPGEARELWMELELAKGSEGQSPAW